MTVSSEIEDKKILHIEGDSYECGFKLGTFFKNEIKKRLARNGITAETTLRFREALEKTDEFHRAHYLFCLDEIRGMADGAGEDYWNLLLLNCPHIKQITEGCTSIAARRPDGSMVVGHNEDGAHGDMPEECALVEFVQPKGRFFSFVYAGELPGCAYNWNESSLYITVNYVPPLENNPLLISRHVVARALLHATTIDEALSIVTRPNNADGYHYFIGQNDELYSVEMVNGNVSVHQVETSAIHANHYVHEKFSDITLGSESSKMRYEKTAALLKEGISIEEILFDRGDAPLCIYCSTDAIRTLSTAFFYPREHRVLVCPRDTFEGSLRFDF